MISFPPRRISCKSARPLLFQSLQNRSILFKLGRAEEHGIITEDEKEEIIKIAKDLYYPQRSYANIFSKVEMEDEKKTRLIDFIVKEKDLKYLDAVAVLECIKELANE